MLENIIIEGVDRLGKGTLIAGLKNALGYFNVIHYQKPEKLECYNNNLKYYQHESFHQMFNMLDVGRLILDRAHLGEAVYSHRYRDYDGDYVFQMELDGTNDGLIFASNTLLVLLTTSDFSFIQDDGLSHDFTKKEEEQEDFKRAFEKSSIKNKLLIDISNGNGGYKPASEILSLVINAFESC